MITYLKGDATKPKQPGRKIIAHICNDIGKWGRGFVMALSASYKKPEKYYLEWHQNGNDFQLGEIQVVNVKPELDVVNMIAQRHIFPMNGIPPIRYEALSSCLEKLAVYAISQNASIHMPRIGAGLAGGEWSKIEEIIEKELKDVEVFIYDL